MSMETPPPLPTPVTSTQPVSQVKPSVPADAKRFAIVTSIFALLLLCFFIYSFFNIFQPAPSKKALTPTPLPTMPEVSATVTPEISQGSAIFTSTELGISFKYHPKTSEDARGTYIAVDGRKVWVYVSSHEFSSEEKMTELETEHRGQYIEIFPKDPNDPLEIAIKKQFLANLPDKDCFVTQSPPLPGYPPSFTSAIISYPSSENAGVVDPNAGRCPAPYTQTNGAAYFVMDVNHPEKFAFLFIGQYAIMADDNLPWQQTLRFK